MDRKAGKKTWKLCWAIFCTVLLGLKPLLASSDDFVFVSYISDIDAQLRDEYTSQLQKEGHSAEWIFKDAFVSPKMIMDEYSASMKDGFVFIGWPEQDGCLRYSEYDPIITKGPWFSFINTTLKSSAESYLRQALYYRSLSSGQKRAYGQVMGDELANGKNLDFFNKIDSSPEGEIRVRLLYLHDKLQSMKMSFGKGVSSYGDHYAQVVIYNRNKLFRQVKEYEQARAVEANGYLLIVSQLMFYVGAGFSGFWLASYLPSNLDKGLALVPLAAAPFGLSYYYYHYMVDYLSSPVCIPALIGDGTLPLGKRYVQ